MTISNSFTVRFITFSDSRLQTTVRNFCSV